MIQKSEIEFIGIETVEDLVGVFEAFDGGFIVRIGTHIDAISFQPSQKFMIVSENGKETKFFVVPLQLAVKSNPLTERFDFPLIAGHSIQQIKVLDKSPE